MPFWRVSALGKPEYGCSSKLGIGVVQGVHGGIIEGFGFRVSQERGVPYLGVRKLWITVDWGPY